MNFLNGMWLVREGVTLQKALDIWSYSFNGHTLRITAPTKKISDRGDTLNLPLITIELTSPKKDVVRFNAWHHNGAKDPGVHFEIKDEHPEVKFKETDETLTFSSGKLQAVISRINPWSIEYYYDNKKLTSSKDGSLAHVIDSDKKCYMREMLGISVGENFYGLGERFTHFVKNGQKVICRNEDGGTCTPQAYKNIPFYLSDRGYGVLVDTPATVEFEIGTEVVSKMQFSVNEQNLSYLVFGGGSMKAALSNYTTLTGRPPILPQWSFGLWLSTSFTTNYDEATTSTMIAGMQERHIPLDVFHYDCFWMKGFQWSDFTFDKEVFPDPEGMLRRNHELGLKNCVWINPYIAQESALFEEGKQNGYLLKRPNGDVWQWDMWQAGMGIVDFTNPAACDWFRSKLEKLLEIGVDAFKTDFGERIPTDVVYYNNADPERMHNYYPYIYNQLVFNLLKEKRGEREAIVFARSATCGCGQFPVHWGGDCEGTFESMAESLRGGLSLTMSGFSFWSHDIGGFETDSSPAVFKRWAAFGLFSSHSRLHGSQGYRVPWAYDEEAVEVTRYFTKLKLSLMPYIYAQSINCHRTGQPFMRSMVLEFEQDPACRALDTQYMFGEKILVAPVFTDEGDVQFYLPEGTWTDFQSGEEVAGGRFLNRNCNFLQLPVYVRENTLLAVNEGSHNSADYNYADGVTYRYYAPRDNEEAVAEVYYEGELLERASAMKEGEFVRFSRSGSGFPAVFEVCGKKVRLEAGECEAVVRV